MTDLPSPAPDSGPLAASIASERGPVSRPTAPMEITQCLRCGHHNGDHDHEPDACRICVCEGFR